MQQVVSITSQGQVNLPQSLLRELGVAGPVKAVVKRQGNSIILEPKGEFWSLAGSLKSKIKLSDQQLRKARLKFSKDWPEV